MPNLGRIGIICWLIGVATTQSMVAQKANPWTIPTEPISTVQRITAHEDTPGHCLAFFSPDRIMWDTAWQETYTYNIAGQLLTKQHDVYNSPGMLRGTLQHFAYDGAGRLADVITQNDSAGNWVNATRLMWYYDAYDNDTLNAQMQWADVGAAFDWDTIGGTRRRLTYGPGNQIASSTSQYWSQGFPWGVWTNISKSEFFFNGLGQWDSLIVYSPFGQNWVASQRLVQVVWADYALGQRSSYLVQYYQGSWLNAQRYSCTYTGLDSDCYTETYNQGTWDSTARATMQYDVQQHLVSAEQWDRGTGVWAIANGEEHLYTYDSLGHTLELVDRNWDPQLHGYVQELWRIYSTFFLANEPRHDISASATAFPNPARDVLNLQLQGVAMGPVLVRIYDLKGHLRVTSSGIPQSGTLRIPLAESLADGPYTYLLSTRSGGARGKFLRIH